MRDYLETMKTRAKELKKAIETAEKKIKDFPEGSLRVSQSGRQVRYYHVLPEGDCFGTYIRRDRYETAKVLAQKDYTKKFIASAKKELTRLEQSIRLLSGVNADQIYERMSINRKELIMPYILTDELYAEHWQAKSYKTNAFNSEGKIYDTRRGEKVRSKSEAILADMMFELGIPYHYEQELILRNKKVRYPDFTLLKKKTREVFYLEHFGLLDDEEYRKDCLNKLNEYRDSGIYPGKNLLITFESKDSPLDIGGTREMFKDITSC